MRVIEVMTHHVECIDPEMSLVDAARKMRELNVGPLPVCGDGERLEGIVTDRDIVIRGIAEGVDPHNCTVRDVMSPGIEYCFEGDRVEEAARHMCDKQIRRLVVLNAEKRLVGIVSLGDLAVDMHDAELVGAALEGISEPAAPQR
jgi:CBS domain-containing protein